MALAKLQVAFFFGRWGGHWFGGADGNDCI